MVGIELGLIDIDAYDVVVVEFVAVVEESELDLIRLEILFVDLLD